MRACPAPSLVQATSEERRPAAQQPKLECARDPRPIAGRLGHHAATYFREGSWSSKTWIDVGEKQECHVTFTIAFPGRDPEQRTLKVSHKPSRESAQANIVTHLHWGRDLIAWLRANSRVGNWVVIQRHEDGSYSITITEERPELGALGTEATIQEARSSTLERWEQISEARQVAGDARVHFPADTVSNSSRCPPAAPGSRDPAWVDRSAYQRAVRAIVQSRMGQAQVLRRRRNGPPIQ